MARRHPRNEMHGHCTNGRTPTYFAWRSILRSPHICARWHNSFGAFLSDMGERPEAGVLVRWPDPHGAFSPKNCQWAAPLLVWEKIAGGREAISHPRPGAVGRGPTVAKRQRCYAATVAGTQHVVK